MGNSCTCCQDHSDLDKKHPPIKSITSEHRRSTAILTQIHQWQTIDDFTLAENIREVLDDIKDSEQNGDMETQQYINAYVFKRLNAFLPQTQQRIIHIMAEIHKQDHGAMSLTPRVATTDHDEDKLDYPEEIDTLLTPSALQNLIKSDEYNIIKGLYRKGIMPLLDQKTKQMLYDQCSNANCPGILKENIFKKCESVQRIDVLLQFYYDLVKCEKLWRKVGISAMICVEIYDHQQIYNDFLHIKMYHIDTDQNIAKILCDKFCKDYKCDDISKCNAFMRHYRDRTDAKKEKEMFYVIANDENSKAVSIQNEKEWVLQEECDKIHSYFLHSTIQFPNHFNINEYGNKINDMKSNIMVDALTDIAEGRSYSGQTKHESNEQEKKERGYVGRTEDEDWLKKIEQRDKEEDKYKLLVKHMGVFRWQSAHGFRTGQYRGLTHLKATFENVKQEALCNSYCKASVDNWNSTLRKSKIFYQSFARQRIKTLYPGSFRDEISDRVETWDRGQVITLHEIVILKLYTDFDKLQHELKKCFRWETIVSILHNDTDKKVDDEEWEQLPGNMDTPGGDTIRDDNKEKEDLEKRLQEFFHWRVRLLTVLNKYGKKINEQNMELYHGVNAKMILNPAETMAFYGPLSTTSSYHVAKTFATAKGMVLKITSQYPRLDFCRAFDASLISDYPEEQEYLIGFVYMRVLEVRTRPIVTDVYDKQLWDKAPEASKIRVTFFSIHLFRQQMFSMSPHLEYYLVEFLKCHLMRCCNPQSIGRQRRDSKIKESFLSFMCCMIAEHEKRYTNRKDWDNIHPTRVTVMKILWNKFNAFRMTPNEKQIIKIDQISDGLKEFFLDKMNGTDIHGNERYAISFEKLFNIFPNLEEVHFINNYRFDNDVLEQLLKYIDEKRDKSTPQLSQENRAKRFTAQISVQSLDQHRSVASHTATNTCPETFLEDYEMEYEDDIHILKKIVFLYYDYRNAVDKDGNILGYPREGNIFMHPDHLDETLIQRLRESEWEIKWNQNGKTGYKIRIYNKTYAKHPTYKQFVDSRVRGRNQSLCTI